MYHLIGWRAKKCYYTRMRFYDLSLPVSSATPEWPGDTKFKRTESKTSAIVSKLTLSSHFATHIDAPRHFLFNQVGVDSLPLAALIGRFKVVKIASRPLITEADVKKIKPQRGERILFKTANSKVVARKKFTSDYVSLSLAAAKFLAQTRVALIGIDYFGIEAKSAPGHPVHKALMAKNIAIAESLNLSQVKPGQYQGAILPLKIIGGDGAPARAVLWR